MNLSPQQIANPTIIEARLEYLTRRNSELADTLLAAQALRPLLLKQYGAVPECVLDYCNTARAVLKRGGL